MLRHRLIFCDPRGIRVEASPAAGRTLGTGAPVFPEQLSWRQGKGSLCLEFRQATHILASDNSSDLIVSESIRERQHLATESREASHSVAH